MEAKMKGDKMEKNDNLEESQKTLLELYIREMEMHGLMIPKREILGEKK